MIPTDDGIARWVGKNLGIDFVLEHAALGVTDGEALVAGVVYHRFTGPGVEMSIYSTSPKWATKAVLRELFRYPFKVMGCRRVTAATEKAAVCKFLKRLGFKHEGTLRAAAVSGSDIEIFGMLRSEAERWLK